MSKAPKPTGEAARIAALSALEILDTPSEERFDRITALARRIFSVPIALISLVDVNRQWFKSCHGLSVSETPIAQSFCAYAILQNEPLIIPNALLDPRFADNPLVLGEESIRFYAGQPLHGPDRQKVGTLCILDRQPRELGKEDIQSLNDLAAWTESELNTRQLGEVLRTTRGSEEKLEHQLSFLSTMTRSLGGAIFAVDRDGRLMFMNSAAEQALGWSEGELLGKDLHAVIHFPHPVGTPHPRGECPIVRAIRAGQVVSVDEDAFTRKDGMQIPVGYVSAPIVSDEGLDGAVLTFRDHSGETLVRKALDERTEVLRERAMLLDLASDAIMVRDVGSSMITYWNHAASEMYGWSVQEALESSSHSLLKTTFPQPLNTIEEELLTTGKWEGELIHTRRDGMKIVVESRWRLLRYEDERAPAVLELNTDVTERKEAERQLAHLLADLEVEYREADLARGQMRAVLDAASDAMILISEARSILSVNRRFTTMFGIEADALLNRDFSSFRNLVQRVFADPEAFSALVMGSASDAERKFNEFVVQDWPEHRDLHLLSTPVRTEDGEYIGCLCTLRDVTHEREMDRMKTEFVSMVSHELRTPLTSIKGYVDLLLDGDAGEVSDEQTEFLGIVKSNADRLVALVNDLLDVSRIEAGKIQLDRRDVDLVPLIRDVAMSLRPQIEAKFQYLTLHLPSTLPPVAADSDRVTQILVNLLSNAHKYTPPNGDLSIEADAEPDRVRIVVKDSGVGLSVEEKQKIFTRFFRARNRATRQVGGTGLGLAITKTLVEMHGGELTVNSTPGDGSSFSFTLPTVAREAQVSEAQVHPVSVGGRVLVVDDEPDIANLIRRYLERAGYEVLVVNSGTDALEVAAAEQPDCITLDIVLPDIDGLKVLERLHAQPSTTDIPFILLSMMEDSGRGKVLGAIDYLIKPVRADFLLHRVAVVLSRADNRLVVVADDEPDIRTLIAHYLRQTGYEVRTAADGEEALDLIRTYHPGLVLVDVNMPRMDGIATLKALRRDASTREIPVMVMTASPGISEKKRAVIEHLGGLLTLCKPLTPETLANTIAQGLQQQFYDET